MFRLASSTTVAGQTAAMIASRETRSPGRSTSTPRTSSAREPYRHLNEIATLVAPGKTTGAPIKTEAIEQKHVPGGERFHGCVSHTRPIFQGI